MDWQVERKMVERIYALLIALAGLADRAARLPMLLRLPVLAILARGEAVARCYVMEKAFGVPGRPDGAESLAAGDAGRLATSFRALALVLGLMLGVGPEPVRFAANAAGPLAGLAMRLCQWDKRNRLRRNLVRPLHHAARGPPPPLRRGGLPVRPAALLILPRFAGGPKDGRDKRLALARDHAKHGGGGPPR